MIKNENKIMPLQMNHKKKKHKSTLDAVELQFHPLEEYFTISQLVLLPCD